MEKKDVVHEHLFHSKLNSKDVASSSGSSKMLLINPSAWQELLLLTVGSPELFPLPLQTLLLPGGTCASA